MRTGSVMLVLTGVLMIMFSVAWSQNSAVNAVNAVANRNAMNRHRGSNTNGRGPATDPCRGIPCAPVANSNIGYDPNDCCNAANTAANSVTNAIDGDGGAEDMRNANAPRKAPKKKRIRRPISSLGGAFTFENSLSAMLAAGVR
jgi:hypothetical protein